MMQDRIDKDGFRLNVGIVLTNHKGQLFWGRRRNMDAWQFPQGGIQKGETPQEAMYRELEEETGLKREHVDILGTTKDWLKYRLPEHFIRYNSFPLCIGQKQIWYLLQLITDDQDVDLECSESPEFDHWEWVNFWDPILDVVAFKRTVYQQALTELAEFCHPSFKNNALFPF